MEPFQLGNWQVSPKLNELKLLNGDYQTSVTPKMMQLLLVLSEQKLNQGDNPLSIDELINMVWAERVVADSSVYQAVAQLRKVLSKDAKITAYIERISGQGYRITPTVEIRETKTNTIKATNSHLLSFSLISFIVLIAGLVWFANDKANEDDNPHFESLSLARHLITQTESPQLEQAKQLYLTVLAEAPDNIEALNGLCNSYRLLTIYGTLTEIERDSLCQPLIENAFRLAPEDHRVLASMARQASELKQTKLAQKLFEQSLSINDQNAFAWHWFGQLQRNQNKVTDALDAHLKAFKLAPNNAVILRGLAYAYLNNRDLTNARKYYERSLVITPKFKNKPLYDLDFYPLTVPRAQNYLEWFNAYNSGYLKKYLSHKLSYIVFLLSINQGELAHKELTQLNPEQLKEVPAHFLLYVKAGLAWHEQNTEQALDLLSQRYQMAPEQNHFVMPYLMALVYDGQYQLALQLFNKHFSNVITASINEGLLGQQLFLARLYKLSANKTEFQNLYSKLLSYRQSHPEFSIHHELVWLDITDDHSRRLELLNALLEQDWLPDYNDSLFIQGYYLSLHTTQQDKVNWLNSLRSIQACIWRQENSKSCTKKK